MKKILISGLVILAFNLTLNAWAEEYGKSETEILPQAGMGGVFKEPVANEKYKIMSAESFEQNKARKSLRNIGISSSEIDEFFAEIEEYRWAFTEGDIYSDIPQLVVDLRNLSANGDEILALFKTILRFANLRAEANFLQLLETIDNLNDLKGISDRRKFELIKNFAEKCIGTSGSIYANISVAIETIKREAKINEPEAIFNFLWIISENTGGDASDILGNSWFQVLETALRELNNKGVEGKKSLELLGTITECAGISTKAAFAALPGAFDALIDNDRVRNTDKAIDILEDIADWAGVLTGAAYKALSPDVLSKVANPAYFGDNFKKILLSEMAIHNNMLTEDRNSVKKVIDDSYFQSRAVNAGLSPVNTFSIAQSVVRYINVFKDGKHSSHNIEYATRKIMAELDEFKKDTILGSETELIVFADSADPAFTTDAITYPAQKLFGVKDYSAFETDKDKSAFLDAIKNSKGETTIWLSGHGGEDSFAGTLSPQELADALLQRGNMNIGEVTIVANACNSWDYKDKVYTCLCNELKSRGVDEDEIELPVMITVTNKGRDGADVLRENIDGVMISDELMYALCKIHKNGPVPFPVTGEDFMKIEEIICYLPDSMNDIAVSIPAPAYDLDSKPYLDILTIELEENLGYEYE